MERKLSDMMCRLFIKGNEVPDTSSVGSIDAETVERLHDQLNKH